jgi:pimeloyl-ACP methyl ester carboxylesterase
VKPTVVLVHGAFADASGFNDVIANLQRRGYPVYAPANPLRGLASDSAYIRSFLATITGPIVLVGHSYGGAVITNAATGNTHVTALVYIAAYALDQGESVGAANDLGGGTTELTRHLVLRASPGSPYPDGYIDPAFFHDIFAADLPTKPTKVMAAAQRPAALAALAEPSETPAWRTIPSWYLVAPPGPRHPAASRTRHGRPSPRPHRGDQQLACRHDQPPQHRHRPHPRRCPQPLNKPLEHVTVPGPGRHLTQMPAGLRAPNSTDEVARGRRALTDPVRPLISCDIAFRGRHARQPSVAALVVITPADTPFTEPRRTQSHGRAERH